MPSSNSSAATATSPASSPTSTWPPADWNGSTVAITCRCSSAARGGRASCSVLRARNKEGELFGIERFVDFVVRHHADRLTVHETLRRLMHAILSHHEGRLEDDATVLLAEWRDTNQDALTR